MRRMADTIAELDTIGRERGTGRDDIAKKRRIAWSSQHVGHITHYEACEIGDGPLCLFVAILVTDTGAQVRVPILPNVGAGLAAEIVRKLGDAIGGA